MADALGKLVAAVVMVVATALHAQTDTKVESSRAVQSPDGVKTAVVDRFTPVVDGEEERFSGRMLVRVTSTDGSPARQRYIEASQVRVIQPPVWVDGSRVTAFVYNVAKNSNGIVYFEPETNRALQVEFVMPTRHMAASGTVEQELTSLEVAELTSQGTLKIRNVPWKGGSAFPLVLSPLPTFEGRPYGAEFLKQLNASLAAYKSFLAKHNVQSLEPEQASESFSEDEQWIGLLACGGADSYLIAVPTGAGAPAAVLDNVKLVKVDGVSLSCRQHTAIESTVPVMEEGRYLTAWASPDVLQVVKETYDMETDAPKVSTVLSLNIKTGEVQDNATTGTLPAQP